MKANLARSDLLGANLAGANLRQTNLVGAEDVELTKAKLCNTILPEYITLDPDRDCDGLQR